MLVKKLIIGLLSFYAVEIRKSSLKSDHPLDSYSIEYSIEKKKKRESEKKKRTNYDNRKWKKKKVFKDKKLKIRGTEAKDARYSNQRMLRRMYRNS